MSSRTHTTCGNPSSSHPQQGGPFSTCFASSGGGRRTDTADSPHTPILCLLSANPAVVSSSDPNPTVAHCSGICCRGNCLWIKCMVLQGLSAALSIPAGSRIFWDTSIHGQYLYLMHSELVLQSELTCLCHPIAVLSDCRG